MEAEKKEAENVRKSAKRWIAELCRAEKAHKAFERNGQRVLKRYRDDKNVETQGFFDEGDSRMNILWSNVETLKPAVYAKEPKPEVSRRFKSKDPVGKLSSIILERCLSYLSEQNDDHSIFELVRDDRLLVGRGQVWIRFVPTFGQSMDPLTGEIMEELTDANIVVDYVHWKDYLEDASARTENEIGWKARKVYLNRKELKKRFGDEIGEEIPLDLGKRKDDDDFHDAETMGGLHNSDDDKSVIYEIWDKSTKKVYWINKHTQYILDEQDDPLELKNFFPCPKALRGTVTNDSVIPLPDYHFYENLAIELDEVNIRISGLIDALRVAGIYDASIDGVQRLIETGGDNILIPVESFSRFQGNGGLKASIEFMPIGEVSNVLAQLYQIRDQLVHKIYEITGISDIIRGAANPYETATAQQIKSTFANLRLNTRQQQIQRFIRDVYRIKAEIVSEHVPDEILAKMSNIWDLGSVDPQMLQEALMLLRDEVSRNYRVSIASDSTIYLDEDKEKNSRIEFLQAVGQFMQLAINIGSQVPEMIPAMGELVMFAIRGFKAGRELESAFEQHIQQATESQSRRLAEDRAQSKGNEKAQKMQMDAQAGQRKAQMDAQMSSQKMQIDAQLEAQKLALKEQQIAAELTLAKEKQDAELQMQLIKTQSELAMKNRQIEEISRREAQRDQQRNTRASYE